MEDLSEIKERRRLIAKRLQAKIKEEDYLSIKQLIEIFVKTDFGDGKSEEQKLNFVLKFVQRNIETDREYKFIKKFAKFVRQNIAEQIEDLENISTLLKSTLKKTEKENLDFQKFRLKILENFEELRKDGNIFFRKNEKLK